MTSAALPQADSGLSAKDVLNALQKNGKVIVLMTVVGVLMALAWSMAQPRVYESTATGVVLARVESDVDSSLAGDNLAKSKAESYRALANSTPVAASAAAYLNLDDTPNQLLSRITVADTNDTMEIRITAEAETAEEAVELAEGYMLALAQDVETLEESAQATANTPAAVGVQLLGDASVPSGPTSPNLSRNLPLGGLAGFIAGLTYALVRLKIRGDSDDDQTASSGKVAARSRTSDRPVRETAPQGWARTFFHGKGSMLFAVLRTDGAQGQSA